MSKEVALFNLLKDGQWHNHLEMREVSGTDFRRRLTGIRRKLLDKGGQYVIEDRPGSGHTLDHRLARKEQLRDAPTPQPSATHLANVESDMERLNRTVFTPENLYKAAMDSNEAQRALVGLPNQERARAAAEATRKQLQAKGIL